MSGYGTKEARINRERRPNVNVNVCGVCGDECTGALCTECVRIETENRQNLGYGDEGEEARTR
jgi:hypothetical protein